MGEQTEVVSGKPSPATKAKRKAEIFLRAEKAEGMAASRPLVHIVSSIPSVGAAFKGCLDLKGREVPLRFHTCVDKKGNWLEVTPKTQKRKIYVFAKYPAKSSRTFAT
jgi:hypothetical protein